MTEEREQRQEICYCGISKDSDLLECNSCHKQFHLGCLVTGRPSPLAGDIYFNLTCKDCGGDGQETCKRTHISWMQTVYLALYNLAMTSSGRKGYFRWKEDICQFIERNWSLLFPKRKRTTAWCSTVAGTLSSGCPQYFKTGQTEFKETGWWSLQEKVAPAEKMGSPGTEIKKKKKHSSKGANKRTAIPLDVDKDICLEAKKTKEEESSDSSKVVRESSELEALPAVVMETDSDDLIARLLKDDEGRSLDEMYFPFMEMDEPFALISDDKQDGGNHNQEESLEMESETTSNTQNEKDLKTHYLQEEEKEQEKSDSESIASTVKSDTKRTTKNKLSKEQEVSTTANLSIVSEADEHEMLCRLNACAETIQDDCAARRLRRKLILRKHKRENGLPIFDLDKKMTSLLSSTKAYVFKDDDFVALKVDGYNEDMVAIEMKSKALQQRKVSVLSRYSRVLDRFLAAPQMLRRKDQHPGSFLNRLVGADRQTLLRPITSPYTARVLKPFIRRDFESRPLKLRLLNEVLAYQKRKDPTWVPPNPHPIDYCYVQPDHIPAVNAMCREFFWPGIDLSECLQYPDFSCVVLYRSFVIAFAFMVPDVKYNEAYISFILVHPEWRRAGIGTYMLYHLIQTCMGKDVTLHVSANNPAMLMYQKFGFKPEEFILDFYEKYLPETSRECRHAFFLRLRR